MGETTAVAHGGDPLWRRCLPCSLAASLVFGKVHVSGVVLSQFSFKGNGLRVTGWRNGFGT
ncbi:hypothetical protein [Moorena sp. SIO3F7]|uniref:hypothetical protein n=1 Tax=Moorena sp. SIO3F7 TaxID=2607839 RepID=UPI00140061D1|nr:hypothetical protein [Moorena sp. SIO3F7]NEO15734.1 hypothetical protein [Moorena sp. SIO3E8]NEQ02181.1 hypothetical protein [Moorena sp. SIO3F7]